MSAAISQPQTAHATPTADWSMLVALDDAARLMGVSVRHLTRQCASDLSARGLAVHCAPPAGGQRRWWIDRRYDRRLTSDAAGMRGAAVGDVSRYSKRQVDLAWQRAKCVDALAEARAVETENQTEWMPRLINQLSAAHPDLRVSRSALYKWASVYRSPADIKQLIDRRGGDQRSTGDPAAWKAFKDYYLDSRQPTLKTCWQRVRELAERMDWRWCSYKTCQRQLNRRVSPEQQLYHRDRARWKGQMQPTIEQGTESWAAGQCWVGDHKQLDVVCRFNGKKIRPWLTAWMDWRTRRVTGWCVSASPNSSTILAALRHGLLDKANLGGPSAVWIDNGKDYDCFALHGQTKQERRAKHRVNHDEPQVTGLFKLLGVEVHFSIPHNPNGKSRLERWFRNLEPLFKAMATYTGRSVDTKPDDLAHTLNKKPHVIPTFEHVRDRVNAFITGNNRRTEHTIDDLIDTDTGERLSPDQALARWCPSKRVLADPGVLDLMLQTWHRPVTVGRNGITLNLLGARLRYGQFDPALTPFKALKRAQRPLLHVSYDPNDVGRIRVFDEQYRFVCEATLNQKGGRHNEGAIGREHLGQLMAEKSAYRRALNTQREHHELAYLTDEERLAELAAPQTEDDTERPLMAVQTPLDGQLKGVQEGQFKQAAGAEFDGGDDDYGSNLLEQMVPDPPTHDDDYDDEPLVILGPDDEPMEPEQDMDVELHLDPGNPDDADDAGSLLDLMR